MPRTRHSEPRSENETLSRRLSYVLRHNAVNLGLPIKSDGFVPVDAILKLPMFKEFNLQNVMQIVAESDKQRFSLQTTESGVLEIRANQGHSFSVPELDVRKINDPAEFPVVVHGTRKDAWESIKSEGLKRMARTHIHFACGIPGDKQVISGMRNSSEVWIYIDLAKALNDGLEFYLSANNVILCKGIGDEGILAPKYFSQVVDAKTSAEIKV